MARPASSSRETSCSRFVSAAVRTRSSVSIRVARPRWTSFSIAYAQHAAASTITDRRSRGSESIWGDEPAGRVTTMTPAATEAITIVVTSQSCLRRRSTASSDGVRNSRSPATRASRRSRSPSGTLSRSNRTSGGSSRFLWCVSVAVGAPSTGRTGDPRGREGSRRALGAFGRMPVQGLMFWFRWNRLPGS